jgi:hypothetical protein
MCGAGDDVLQDLLELVNEPDDFRLQRHQGRISDQLRTLIFHESTATQIHSYQPTYIPGVAQTADYARAVFEASDIFEPSQIEGRVQIRTGRAALVLDRPKPALCKYYIHEAALRVPIGGPRVMHEQLLHLLFLGNRAECAIRVVPMSAGARGMVDGSFQIFDYKEDPPLVFLQHETTSEFLENDEEVASYRRILQRVASVALDGPQTREFLAQVASDLERQEEARHDARDAGRLAQE